MPRILINGRRFFVSVLCTVLSRLRRTSVKTALKVIGIVVGVLLVAAIALPFVVNVNSFRPQIESRLSEALGRPVTVGNLSLSLLSGGVGADQLSIADDPKFGNSPFIK